MWEKDKTAYLVCLYHSERRYNSIKKFIDELVRSAKRTKVKWVKSLSRVRHFVTPWTVAYGLLHPWDFPGKSTGVGCHCLLQGIFLTQGSNSGLPHCRQTLYRLSHQGPIKRVSKSCLCFLVFHSCLWTFCHICFSSNLPNLAMYQLLIKLVINIYIMSVVHSWAMYGCTTIFLLFILLIAFFGHCFSSFCTSH